MIESLEIWAEIEFTYVSNDEPDATESNHIVCVSTRLDDLSKVFLEWDQPILVEQSDHHIIFVLLITQR